MGRKNGQFLVFKQKPGFGFSAPVPPQRLSDIKGFLGDLGVLAAKLDCSLQI